ncbi:hypothetical protein CCZ37_12415 [Vibrio qinghaiensis]|uniref:Glycosyl transferase family 1 domain-containing protein n=1 Tax=Vibrio qinghaiensis TaxID=2025808 RepID=A0A223N0G4_9VIBR|nr:glycosyltransferase [Vibrio qinghaiensis]ASU23344.1 hypothetical protein CCZ37_12415 [Vibrio qinghaiensis]
MELQRKKPIRVMWLLNHTTLRDFEVPLLQSMGCEIFVPKIIPENEANRSADVTYIYDKSLTLDADKLERLNQQDFYNHGLTGVEDIANDEFDLVFCGFFPEQLKHVVSSFLGFVFLRVFGLAGEATYTGILQENEPELYSELCKIEQRFVFAQAYSNLSVVETGLFKEKALTFKLSLPKELVSDLSNKWNGEKNQLFTVCPRINSSPAYYGVIYEEMKKYFSGYPWIIGGAQPIAVDDERVLGFISRSELNQHILSSSVMFYHSNEKRHLHYHPIEAIIAGQPLIYMQGGLLGEIANSKLPGACSSYEEAQEKIERILSGDKEFIREVKKSQQILLEEFDPYEILNQWKNNFELLGVDGKNKKFRTIAVILPIAYSGGTLNACISTIQNIFKLSEKGIFITRIVFSIPHGHDYSEDLLESIRSEGVEIRVTNWLEVSHSEVENIRRLSGYSSKIIAKSQRYSLPDDGLGYLQDCDHWLVVSDRLSPPLAPIKPYSVLVFDYIQRYIPGLYHGIKEAQIGYMYTVRNSNRVIVTTEHTAKDINSYAGVNRNKISIAPMCYQSIKKYLVDNPKDKKIESENKYIIWTTNSGPHKNQELTLKAFSYYKECLDGQLDLVITGVDTNRFDSRIDKNDKHHLAKVTSTYHSLSELTKSSIRLMGELTKERYASILNCSDFLLHSCEFDNGTFCLLEAKELGVPCLSSKYPQIVEMDRIYDLNVVYIEERTISSFAKRLKYMEQLVMDEPTNSIDKKVVRNIGLQDFSNAFKEVLFG